MLLLLKGLREKNKKRKKEIAVWSQSGVVGLKSIICAFGVIRGAGDTCGLAPANKIIKWSNKLWTAVTGMITTRRLSPADETHSRLCSFPKPSPQRRGELQWKKERRSQCWRGQSTSMWDQWTSPRERTESEGDAAATTAQNSRQPPLIRRRGVAECKKP